MAFHRQLFFRRHQSGVAGLCLLRFSNSAAGRGGRAPSTRSQLHATTEHNTTSIATAINRTTPSSAVLRPQRPLQNLPTAALVRNVLLGRIFCSPRLSWLGMGLLRRIANSRAGILDPDKNLLLNKILRTSIYDQFCAGSTRGEIERCVAGIKRMGYAGVILNYAREIVAHDHGRLESNRDLSAEHIQQWLAGNMKTLEMLAKGDYLGIKYTGAGDRIAKALKNNEDPPAPFAKALHDLCRQAAAQGSRIWVDAEQQVYQPTIDRWTVDIMRRYNRNRSAVVLNTYQAYLKCTRDVLKRHLELARREGWTLGIKLVRGAYLGDETRSLIHDTKAETDDCYDGITHDLLNRSFDDIGENIFPRVKLFLAGHNADSIRRASTLHKQICLHGGGLGVLEFGQLYGMADHISGELLAENAAMKRPTNASDHEHQISHSMMPQVYKCVNWGSVRECLHFLMRRAAENQGAADRLHDGVKESKRELKARMLR